MSDGSWWAVRAVHYLLIAAGVIAAVLQQWVLVTILMGTAAILWASWLKWGRES